MTAAAVETKDPARAETAAPTLHRAGFAAVERQANRAAQILMPLAGAIFWLALVIAVLAASLGWRLALL